MKVKIFSFYVVSKDTKGGCQCLSGIPDEVEDVRAIFSSIMNKRELNFITK